MDNSRKFADLLKKLETYVTGLEAESAGSSPNDQMLAKFENLVNRAEAAKSGAPFVKKDSPVGQINS